MAIRTASSVVSSDLFCLNVSEFILNVFTEYILNLFIKFHFEFICWILFWIKLILILYSYLLNLFTKFIINLFWTEYLNNSSKIKSKTVEPNTPKWWSEYTLGLFFLGVNCGG